VLRAPEWAKPEGLAYLEEAKIKTTAGTGATLEEKAKTSVRAEAKGKCNGESKTKCGGLSTAVAKARSPAEMTKFLSKGIEWNRQRQRRRRYE
jgi:hypothetical protein